MWIHIFSASKRNRNQESVINIKNNDNLCFKWSVTRALNPVEKNSERITKELKEQSVKLNWNGLTFPVKLNKIGIFEKKNPKISVNVFWSRRRHYFIHCGLQKQKERKNKSALDFKGKTKALLSHQKFEQAALKSSFRPQGIKIFLSELIESFSE